MLPADQQLAINNAVLFPKLSFFPLLLQIGLCARKARATGQILYVKTVLNQ